MKKLTQRYYTSKDLKNIGYRNYDIKDFVDTRKLVKLKVGVYREASLYNEHQSFIAV